MFLSIRCLYHDPTSTYFNYQKRFELLAFTMFFARNLYLCLPTLILFSMQAHSAYRGVGIVKLMGRSSGFIAMQAALASGQIDICLIPEV